MITRADWTDWYVDDDESAVFVDGQVIVLSTLATFVLKSVGKDGATVAALEAALVEAFGAPDGGDATAATLETVATLVEAGVLVDDR